MSETITTAPGPVLRGDIRVTGLMVLCETSDGELRAVKIEHPNHCKKILGLVKHLQGGTLRLGKESLGVSVIKPLGE